MNVAARTNGDKEVAEMGSPLLLAISPSHFCDPQIPIAAIRFGETGILDLGICQPDELRRESVECIQRQGRSDSWGVRCDLIGDAKRLAALFHSLDGVIERGGMIPLAIIAGGPAGSTFNEFAEQSLELARQRAARLRRGLQPRAGVCRSIARI